VSGGDQVHLVLTWIADFEQAAFDEGPPAGAEDTPGVYEADVPAELWAALVAAEQAREEAHRAVVEAFGFAEDLGRMELPCGAWTGTLDPGRSWWDVVLDSSEDPGSGPARPVRLASRDTERDAVALVESLPAAFHVLDLGGQLTLVYRDRVAVAPAGWGPSASACSRCGWERSEHPAAHGEDPD
jgi:hypothetical protein